MTPLLSDSGLLKLFSFPIIFTTTTRYTMNIHFKRPAKPGKEGVEAFGWDTTTGPPGQFPPCRILDDGYFDTESITKQLAQNRRSSVAVSFEVNDEVPDNASNSLLDMPPGATPIALSTERLSPQLLHLNLPNNSGHWASLQSIQLRLFILSQEDMEISFNVGFQDALNGFLGMLTRLRKLSLSISSDKFSASIGVDLERILGNAQWEMLETLELGHLHLHVDYFSMFARKHSRVRILRLENVFLSSGCWSNVFANIHKFWQLEKVEIEGMLHSKDYQFNFTEHPHLAGALAKWLVKREPESECPLLSHTEPKIPYVVQLGRHYCKGSEYLLPIDEKARDCEKRLYRIFDDLVGLCCTQIPDYFGSSRFYVIDIGTGTGFWAINFAKKHPTAEVLGLDLSDQWPVIQPENCYFEVGDLENADKFLGVRFHMVFSHSMLFAIRDWQGFCKSSFNSLFSGGCIEIQEITFPLHHHPEGPEEACSSNIDKWAKLVTEGARECGIDLKATDTIYQCLSDAGFVEIECRTYTLPLGSWDKAQEDVGSKVLEYFLEAVEGMTLKPLRKLGWKEDEMDQLQQSLRTELSEGKHRLLLELVVFCGKKPKTSDEDDSTHDEDDSTHDSEF